MTESELEKLAQAMDWVIPPDSSPGAGTPAGVRRLVELIASEPPEVAEMYSLHLAGLRPEDLSDPANRFARLFVEHVRDIYYGSPDTGSWADIGFRVTDP